MRLAILFLMVATMLACSDNGPQININPVSEEKKRIALIFSDVTSSLVEPESEQVATLTADVIDRLPNGTSYFVYPIQIEPGRLKSIANGRLVFQKDPEIAKAFKDQRRKTIGKEIKDLYESIRSAKVPAPQYGRPDNHSCILETLSFAEEFLNQFDPNRHDIELIYISDMIEECNNTPMRRPISLATTNIADLIRVAEDADIKANLSYVKLSVIIPATKESYVIGSRPSLADLRSFWKVVFRKCGLDPETLRDQNRFYFATELPVRFTGNS